MNGGEQQHDTPCTVRSERFTVYCPEEWYDMMIMILGFHLIFELVNGHMLAEG